MTRPIVFSSFSAGSPTLIVRPCFSLSSTSCAMSRNSRGVERVLGEPAVDDRRQRAAVLHVRVGVRPACPPPRAARRRSPGPAACLVLTTITVGLALEATVSATRAEQEAAVRRRIRRLGRCAHHHQVVVRRLADDGRRGPMSPRAGSPRTRRVPPCSRTKSVERLLLALQRALADPLRHDVQHHHLRPEALAQVAGQAHRQLGVRPAADRHQDRAHVVEAALLDDRDVARRLAHHRVDRRGEDRRPVAPRTRAPPRPCAAAAGRRRAAPAEDDEVGAFLADRLDHAVGGPPADADHGPDLDALLVAEVEHALQQAARGARLGARPRTGRRPPAPRRCRAR